MVSSEEIRHEKALKRILNYHGEEAQIDMMIEECSELIQAICKYNRKVPSCATNAEIEILLDNVREEIVDVQIMLDQMKLVFGYDYELEEMKSKRTLELIESEGQK